MLDDNGTRIQKLQDDVVTTTAGGHGDGKRANQFGAYHFFVTDDAIVYVSDYSNHRVQRWVPGAVQGVTVAGGNGAGPRSNQLHHPLGLFVTKDATLYVADTWNHRVVKWLSDATAGLVVAGGHGSGSGAHQLNQPADVALDARGALYVMETERGCRRVTRWGPPPTASFKR